MSDNTPSRGVPLVVLDVDYDRGAFELVLVNIGTAVAHDIRVKFTRALVGAGENVITDLPIFEHLRTLRPDKEVRVFLDAAATLFGRRKTNTFGAAVTWRDPAGKDHKANYRHDLDAYRCLPERLPPAATTHDSV